MNLEDIQIGRQYVINETFPDAKYHGDIVTVVEIDPPRRRFRVICDHAKIKECPHAPEELDELPPPADAGTGEGTG